MTASFDRLLDATRLDHARGLTRHGCDWALFGLSLDPDAWLEADAETQSAIDPIWRAAGGWSREHAGALHGLIVGARAEVRSLRAAGVQIENRTWADLGGASGHYAVALLLEGAADAMMIDESDPGPLARSVMETANVVVRIGNAATTDVMHVDAVLALYSLDPDDVLHACPWIETAVVAPVGGRARRGVQAREVSWQTRFLMGEGACGMVPAPITTTMEVRERLPRQATASGRDRAP